MTRVERLLCWLFPRKDIYNPSGQLFLRRWFVFPRRPQGWSEARRPFLCLHKFYLSDADRDPHTHPSWFVTACGKGGYINESYERRGQGRAGPFLSRMWPGRIAFRNANHTHRAILKPGRTSWTLVLMGPARATWGFLLSGGAWVPEAEYRASRRKP